MAQETNDLVQLENIGKLRARKQVELEAVEMERTNYLQRVTYHYDYEISCLKEEIARFEDQALQIVSNATADKKVKNVKTSIGKFSVRKSPDVLTVSPEFNIDKFVGSLGSELLEDLEQNGILNIKTKTTYSLNKSNILKNHRDLNTDQIATLPNLLDHALEIKKGIEKCSIKYDSPVQEIASLKILNFNQETP